MSINDRNGKWKVGKITLLCTVIGTVSGCIIALPTAIEYGNKAIAPWTSMPAQISRIERKVDTISDALNVQQPSNYAQNYPTNFHIANQLQTKASK
jgi:hypothetical protein